MRWPIAQGKLPTRLALTWNDRDGVGADGITANQEAGISGRRLPESVGTSQVQEDEFDANGPLQRASCVNHCQH